MKNLSKINFILALIIAVVQIVSEFVITPWMKHYYIMHRGKIPTSWQLFSTYHSVAFYLILLTFIFAIASMVINKKSDEGKIDYGAVAFVLSIISGYLSLLMFCPPWGC